MLDGFDFDGLGPPKRWRDEELGADGHRPRPQAKFVAELVELYYVRISRIEQEQGRVRGLEIYSLGDLAPSLAQRVGATAHYFQLIEERCVPVSFARSNVPLDPPRRPFIAAVLAVLVQGFVLDKSGVYVSVSAFDTWFALVNHTDGAPISKYWLEAKMHIANCVASKESILSFGQGIIRKQFGNLSRLGFLHDRVVWMIQVSVSNRNGQLHSDGFVDFATSIQAMQRTGKNAENCASKGSLIWPMWNKAFVSLCVPSTVPVDRESDTSEHLFSQGVENSIHFIKLVNEVISGKVASNGEGDFLLSDLYLLCGATSGELAAILLFSALKHTLCRFFSGRPMSRLVIELSIEVMSKLFDSFVRFFLFTSPAPRHYHLLDACQKIWRVSLTSRRTKSDGEYFTSRRQDQTVFVRQEDVFYNHHTLTYCSPKQKAHTTTPPMFSACVSTVLRSGEKLRKLIGCLQFQHQNIVQISRNKTGNIDVGSQLCYVDRIESPCPMEDVSNSFAEFAAPTSWCTLKLPIETEDSDKFLDSFLRSQTDRLAKQCVDTTLEKSTDVNRSGRFLL